MRVRILAVHNSDGYSGYKALIGAVGEFIDEDVHLGGWTGYSEGGWSCGTFIEDDRPELYFGAVKVKRLR